MLCYIRISKTYKKRINKGKFNFRTLQNNGQTLNCQTLINRKRIRLKILKLCKKTKISTENRDWKMSKTYQVNKFFLIKVW